MYTTAVTQTTRGPIRAYPHSTVQFGQSARREQCRPNKGLYGWSFSYILEASSYRDTELFNACI